MADPSPEALAWLADRTRVVLVTLRADGSPQTSNVVAVFDGDAFSVSVTDGRAKTHNLRRDPRAVAHVLGDDFWSYASARCRAELSPVSTAPGDETGRRLLALHDAVSDEPHPDPDDFHASMVADHRLVLRLVLEDVVGAGW